MPFLNHNLYGHLRSFTAFQSFIPSLDASRQDNSFQLPPHETLVPLEAQDLLRTSLLSLNPPPRSRSRISHLTNSLDPAKSIFVLVFQSFTVEQGLAVVQPHTLSYRSQPSIWISTSSDFLCFHASDLQDINRPLHLGSVRDFRLTRRIYSTRYAQLPISSLIPIPDLALPLPCPSSPNAPNRLYAGRVDVPGRASFFVLESKTEGLACYSSYTIKDLEPCEILGRVEARDNGAQHRGSRWPKGAPLLSFLACHPTLSLGFL